MILKTPDRLSFWRFIFYNKGGIMKNISILLALLSVLTACEVTDTRTRAANIIYNNCIQSGESTDWCRCIRADLIDSEKAFTQEMANFTLKGYQHPWLAVTLTGARIRCDCRMFPQRVVTHGLSCTGVKPITF